MPYCEWVNDQNGAEILTIKGGVYTGQSATLAAPGTEEHAMKCGAGYPALQGEMTKETMDTTVLKILLIATAVAIPAWIVWRRSHKRPWLGGWLFFVGLLILPYGLTVWLHPEWLAHPVPFLAKHLVILPAFFSLSALAGGLVPLALALLLALGKAFGEAFKDVKWQEPVENQGYGGITRKEVTDPFDIYNDCDYSVYRRSIWDDDSDAA